MPVVGLPFPNWAYTMDNLDAVIEAVFITDNSATREGWQTANKVNV